MSYSSDEFDGDIRQPLYDLIGRITNNMPKDNPTVWIIKQHLLCALHVADDHRINLMDEEGELDKHEDEN